MKFPDKLDVLSVHARLIAETGGSLGLRDEGLLESALLAPVNRHSYEDANLVECAAAYAYHLTKAHAFIDGNKRVAAAVMETFLESNGSRLAMTDEEIVRLFLDVASGLLSRHQIERLLRDKITEPHR